LLAQDAAPAPDDDDEPDSGAPNASARPGPPAAAPEPQDDSAKPLRRFGDSRRIDPFDANENEARPRSSPITSADPSQTAIVCIAGCDSPPSKRR
jgi:hypothetical protein